MLTRPVVRVASITGRSYCVVGFVDELLRLSENAMYGTRKDVIIRLITLDVSGKLERAPVMRYWYILETDLDKDGDGFCLLYILSVHVSYLRSLLLLAKAL